MDLVIKLIKNSDIIQILFFISLTYIICFLIYSITEIIKYIINIFSKLLNNISIIIYGFPKEEKKEVNVKETSGLNSIYFRKK